MNKAWQNTHWHLKVAKLVKDSKSHNDNEQSKRKRTKRYIKPRWKRASTHSYPDTSAREVRQHEWKTKQSMDTARNHIFIFLQGGHTL